jgi:glutamine cyclotransferase
VTGLLQRVLAASVLILGACAGTSERQSTPAPALRPQPVRILAVHPHDPQAFTQGLLWSGGRLYESTGLYGRSTVREVDPDSGRVLRSVSLPDDQFGEGLALVGERLIQLTWREQDAFVWRLSDLASSGRIGYQGEGWGLTWDGKELLASDGSAVISRRSPEDLRSLGTVTVRRAGREVPYLNELEWVEGALYANVWQSDEILRIDPASGEVTGAWDASGLLEPEERQHADVLNGIAWNPQRRVFYLTGKLWPRLFEVQLPDASEP